MDGAGGDTAAPAAGAAAAQGKRDEWTETSVHGLLESYESKWLLRNRAKLKWSDWEEIARQVSTQCPDSAKGVGKSPNQCKNKVEAMKKRYRAETAAAAREAGRRPSWRFYSRMDDLLKGAGRCAAVEEANCRVHIHSYPKMDGKSNHHANSSNTLPKDANNGGNDFTMDEKKDRPSGSSPRSDGCGNEEFKEEREGMMLRKKRKGSGCEIAKSIRMLTDAMLKIEQAKMEMCKDSERMRVELEIKRGEMELRRTEIIAKTHLEIARLFARRLRQSVVRTNGSPLRAETDGRRMQGGGSGGADHN